VSVLSENRNKNCLEILKNYLEMHYTTCSCLLMQICIIMYLEVWDPYRVTVTWHKPAEGNVGLWNMSKGPQALCRYQPFPQLVCIIPHHGPKPCLSVVFAKGNSAV
jgi:hypothetical protein